MGDLGLIPGLGRSSGEGKGYPLQYSGLEYSGLENSMDYILWIMEKARDFQKNIYFCFIDYAKAFDCVDHNQLWKF